MPPARHPYLNARFAALAHRGGWLEAADQNRENTRYAFARAVEAGFGYLETDVRTTADGQLVVFHDDLLDRVTDATGPVAAHSWRELAGVRIGGVDPIPSLAELLEEFPTARFNIDLKEPAAIAPLAELVIRMDATSRVLASSFSTARLRAFRRLVPAAATAISPAGVAWATHAFGLRRWPVDPGVAFQIPVRHARVLLPLVRPDVIAHAHASGRAVHVWTINDESEMHRLIDLGVDGLVSDDLATLKRVLVERGLWEEA